MADGPSFSYEKLVRETWHKKFVYKSHTEPSKFLVRETWQMTETINNFKFYFFSWLHSIINKIAKRRKKDETTNKSQQRNIVKKTKRTSNQWRCSISITWLQLSRTEYNIVLIHPSFSYVFLVRETWTVCHRLK